MCKNNKALKVFKRSNQYGLISYFRKLLEPLNPRTLEPFSKGFTLIEIIIVIVILSIVSAITIKFLVDSLRIYTMTVYQKTLFDEAKLALERMCRDIQDANSITSTSNSITLTRTNATAQDIAGESITFRLTGSTLEKVKASVGYAMVSNVSALTVTNRSNEITLQLTLSLGTGENVTLQTKVYPKNLGDSTTYKNFRVQDSGGNFTSWQEELSS
jgi:prepilin-type N-terminal cleavage/methylation domain-containing protein